MTEFKLPYVKAERGRDGRVNYWYFRRYGRRWRLPGTPLAEEFMRAYWRLVEETNATSQRQSDRPHHGPGSFGALVRDYLASGEFRQLKERTKAEYRRVLEQLADDHGHRLVRDLKRRHVRRLRDERADTPGAANTFVRMLKLLLNFAVEEEWIEANPAARVKLLKVGEWRAWTDEERAAFENRWAPGTMERRAYALALYTGQRKSDLVSMARAHRKAGTIRVVQGKTSEEVWIPEHRELTAELSRGVAGHMSLLTTTQGKAFDAVYFGAWFADAIEAAGLPEDCVLHGLRKTAARLYGTYNEPHGRALHQGRRQEEARERSNLEAREQQMNADWQTHSEKSGKHPITDGKTRGESWRSLRESNSSFQIENLTS